MKNNEIYDEAPRAPSGSGESVAYKPIIRTKTGIQASPGEIQSAYFMYLCSLSGLDGGYSERKREHDEETYFQLAMTLHSIPFRGGVPNDDNRAIDGKNLREEFSLYSSKYADYSPIIKPEASFLEMIVGLAKRMDFTIMRGFEDQDRTKNWVFLMLDNIGVSEFNDEIYDIEADICVRTAVKMVIDREYNDDGVGCLFPKFWNAPTFFSKKPVIKAKIEPKSKYDEDEKLLKIDSFSQKKWDFPKNPKNKVGSKSDNFYLYDYKKVEIWYQMQWFLMNYSQYL